MSEQFELTEQPIQPILSIRTRTTVANLPNELGRAFHAIINYLAEIGETTNGPAIAGYHNMDMENLDVEIGFPVTKPLPGKGEIQASSIPAGWQVSCMHKGSYSRMQSVYGAMAKWMQDNGHAPAGVAYELYYNSPVEVPESELLTKIVFPLVK